ncbi:MAG: hypothetical protein QXL01_01335 [Thermoplasmatales archaeon]
MSQTYGHQYHTYPVHSEETSYEGSFKRFTTFPTPKEVYDYALMGIPKVFPITNEPIPESFAQTALESAITEIENETGMDLSPVTRYHSEDYIDGMFTNNFMGIRLQHWPATKIIQMQLKFPHTNTAATYQRYTIPANWIYLKKNRLNVVAAMGSVTVGVDNESLVSAGGIFTYITGFARGAYAPGTTEIVYESGWQHDKLPSHVADLVKTWAAYRMLPDMIPVLAPNNGVSVSIDGVSQSTSYNLAQLLATRVQLLEKKKQELTAAITKSFGRTLKLSQIGS